MAAYVVVMRERTRDPEQLALYAERKKTASVGHAMTVLAWHGRHEVVEGPEIEAAAILEFPSFEAAKAWYTAPAYQKVLPFRLNGGDYRCVIIDGS